MQDTEQINGHREMKITGLSPYWFDAAEGSAVVNTINMESMFLLTGPNGGGKSSLLRSICAAALLGVCGFMVPAESALIPHFDSIMLHVKSYDSPADGKSSFQVPAAQNPTSLCTYVHMHITSMFVSHVRHFFSDRNVRDAFYNY